MIRFRSLAGPLPLQLPALTSLDVCRQTIGNYFGVCSQKIHLYATSSEEGLYSVVVCATYKICCWHCGTKLECSCDLDDRACACAPQQDRSLDETLCSLCCLEYAPDTHWCGEASCVACRNAGDETGRTTPRPRRSGPSKKKKGRGEGPGGTDLSGDFGSFLD
jgi:hypothetical protein